MKTSDKEVDTHVASLPQSGEQATGGQAPATPHSPLPWQRGIAMGVGVPVPNYIVDGDGRHIFRANDLIDGWPACSFANAEFIVRAVNSHAELVAALKAIVDDAWEMVGDEAGASSVNNRLIDVACAVLAKVEAK